MARNLSASVSTRSDRFSTRDPKLQSTRNDYGDDQLELKDLARFRLILSLTS